MARSIGFATGAGERRLSGWAEAMAALKRRVFETLGFGLLLVALVIAAALFSYSPQDPSLDTAIDSAAHNFLGHDGAVLADLSRQGLGMAAFVVPMVLFGWSLRLVLDRPLKRLWLKLGLLPVALVLAALALSVLDHGTPSHAADCGGAVGWGLHRLLTLVGLGPAALPVAMIAAAGVGLLLLMILGLSWRDWRDLGSGAGNGAGRLAVFSARGTRAMTGLGGRLLWRWWRMRSGRADAAAAGPQRRSVVMPMPQRREPRLDRAVAPEIPGTDRDRARPVRLVASQAKPAGPGRRGEEERQPRLDLVPDQEPVLPSLELLNKPPAAKTAAIDEE
ncbi:MAG: DNA translocase FtsK 4TM domain-containing protein, partial [Stellaceae bacterium]